MEYKMNDVSVFYRRIKRYYVADFYFYCEFAKAKVRDLTRFWGLKFNRVSEIKAKCEEIAMTNPDFIETIELPKKITI